MATLPVPAMLIWNVPRSATTGVSTLPVCGTNNNWSTVAPLVKLRLLAIGITPAPAVKRPDADY